MCSGSVVFLGLYYPTVDSVKLRELQVQGAEVWTMNDYYLYYPWLMADGIFQIHKPEWLPLNKNNRWTGDYKGEYNAANCPVYACWPDKGLDNEVIMDNTMMSKWFTVSLYQCTICYMLAVAMDQGKKKVIIEGMEFLSDGERDYQLPYIMACIKISRKNGLEVEIDPEIEARWANSIDWGNLKDIAAYHTMERRTPLRGDELRVDISPYL